MGFLHTKPRLKRGGCAMPPDGDVERSTGPDGRRQDRPCPAVRKSAFSNVPGRLPSIRQVHRYTLQTTYSFRSQIGSTTLGSETSIQAH